MASITTMAKAEALSLGIERILGQRPQVVQTGTGLAIKFTPEQAARLRAVIRAQLNQKRNPSDVSIDVAPVLNPLFIEIAIPYALALVALGFLLSRIAKR
ncbi:MAG TPA: hypothetical protein VLH56_19655 [Dissulfurispiraceae bacterium]|nr:hypothetical protein [Dissulfurispiraceae bacterium]